MEQIRYCDECGCLTIQTEERCLGPVLPLDYNGGEA